MAIRFVVRLLSAEDDLLAWAEVLAEPQGQPGRASGLFMASPRLTKFPIEQDGIVTKIAVHWPELDVARVKEMPPTAVRVGQVFDFIWFEPVWMVVGMADVVLPAVTMRSAVAIKPPTGNLVGASQ